MASTSAIAPVSTSILAALVAEVALTARVPSGRITDDGAARPTYPYIVVEASDERPFNTMGPASLAKWGSIAPFAVRIVSQYRGDQEAAEILGLVKAVLDGQPLTVAGYQSVIVAFTGATMLKDTVAGVVTRELLAQFDVTVHQG